MSWRRTRGNCLVGFFDRPKKCTLGLFALFALFPAGVELTQPWTFSCSWLNFFPYWACSIYLYRHRRLMTFSWAAASTRLRCSSSSCPVSNYCNFVYVSILKRCLKVCSSASCCFSSSSLLSLDVSKSRWCWVNVIEEVICKPDFELWDVFCFAVSLFWTKSNYAIIFVIHLSYKRIFSRKRKIKELLILLNYTCECIFGFYNQKFDLFPVLLVHSIVNLNTK